MDLRVTESPSVYRHLEKKSVDELVELINQEDQSVAVQIKQVLPQLSRLIKAIVEKISGGGRLFYVGAGSGGRLSVLDVIELPTTYGLPKGIFNVILAGGIDRLADALEEKEDDTREAWEKLQAANVTTQDIVIGISASGTTPFVLAALYQCRQRSIPTGCIVSNPDSPIAAASDFPVEVITGPEFVTGSTRMKCGTAQKMIFDMISTTTMIQLGRVEDNSMVNVALINDKITDRAVRMLMEKAGISDYEEAKMVLLKYGSVKQAMEHVSRNV
ncbi:N-acetylmuramic acid 6-phosphate etherase [Parapedobacter defluvii]|uniref:N-acetylmuramic acid 6-phosphate etherase n=2 Tax=Parapedobacter defluvii TaxID=2045106 RepID=A0ABQ1LP22_9SPHI|nr:N-acetylmuramic acid 6-phosphate etherase [Parapedobacter defluvii]RQP13427.1 MAG: N-acetylmuramic acid 6-phosphate etherase [Parapedobacter sp.]GGC27394.1 N-acetylmuramic acid 6-phosphate etherase [Parapedobacter defluvii]